MFPVRRPSYDTDLFYAGIIYHHYYVDNFRWHNGAQGITILNNLHYNRTTLLAPPPNNNR